MNTTHNSKSTGFLQVYLFEVTTAENEDYIYGFFQFKTTISSLPNKQNSEDDPLPPPTTTSSILPIIVIIMGLSAGITGLVIIYRKIVRKEDIEIS